MTDTQRAACKAAIGALESAISRLESIKESSPKYHVFEDIALYFRSAHGLKSALAEPDGWLPIAMTEIQAERDRQNEQWGGPAHDDSHASWVWLQIIEWQIGKHKNSPAKYEPESSRHRLIKITAVALAGLESIERNKSIPPPPGESEVA